jgi:hypothetical protein
MPQVSGGAGTGIVTLYEAVIQTAEIATAIAAELKANSAASLRRVKV